ncbi:MAG: hypothetical protein WAV85_10410 [Rhodoferax sp.]
MPESPALNIVLRRWRGGAKKPENRANPLIEERWSIASRHVARTALASLLAWRQCANAPMGGRGFVSLPPEFDSLESKETYIPNGINSLAAVFQILVVARFKQ